MQGTVVAIRRGVAVVIAAALLLLATLAPAASAAPAAVPTVFSVKGTAGYSLIGLMAYPKGSSPGDPRSRPPHLLLFVSGSHSGVTYSAPAANVGINTIRADLGGLGSIDLRFQPSGAVGTARSSCGNQSIRFQRGRFVGSVHFVGEQGFTRVDSAGARARGKFLLDLLCPGASGGTVSGGAGGQLKSRSGGGHDRVYVAAAKKRPAGRTYLLARIAERRGAIQIIRVVEMTAPSAALIWSGASHAELDPPAPFDGTAVFERTPAGAKRWKGDLTIDFPGRSDVPLTGQGFDPSFRRVTFSGKVLL